MSQTNIITDIAEVFRHPKETESQYLQRVDLDVSPDVANMNASFLSTTKFPYTEPMTMTGLLNTTTDTLNLSHATVTKRRHHKDSNVPSFNDNKSDSKPPPRMEWSSSTIVETDYLDVMALRKRQHDFLNKTSTSRHGQNNEVYPEFPPKTSSPTQTVYMTDVADRDALRAASAVKSV